MEAVSAEKRKKAVSPYAAPARQTDYTNLPPAYTFVGNGEPFNSETCTYIENLQKAGVDAQMDVYESDMHAFDMLKPELQVSKEAAAKFNLSLIHISEPTRH